MEAEILLVDFFFYFVYSCICLGEEKTKTGGNFRKNLKHSHFKTGSDREGEMNLGESRNIQRLTE